jgi:16S rRNA G1207 methylase RsmC
MTSVEEQEADRRCEEAEIRSAKIALLDRFVLAMLPGVFANRDLDFPSRPLAERLYAHAQALLEERNKLHPLSD